MIRRLFLAALAALAVLGLSVPADAGSVWMCRPAAPGTGSAGPGQYKMQGGTATTYSLDRWGCAAISFTDVGEATANGFSQQGALRAAFLTGATAATSVTLPPSAYIVGVLVQNQSATSVTNGLKFGTTSGGTDIISGILAAAGNTLTSATDASLAKRALNMTQANTVFIDAVTSWNSARVQITVLYSFY